MRDTPRAGIPVDTTSVEQPIGGDLQRRGVKRGLLLARVVRSSTQTVTRRRWDQDANGRKPYAP